MQSTGEKFSKFLLDLNFKIHSGGISIINPYGDDEVRSNVKTFCHKFYSKEFKRVLILGINPGRLGGGVTGISFTDPFALKEYCGIMDHSPVRPTEASHRPGTVARELSSRFIYSMIEVYGGAGKFYDHFLLSATCPLGFLKGTTNYNYYDSPSLLEESMPLIEDSLLQHSGMGVRRDVVISLGKKNASYLEKINRRLRLFDKVIFLDHPRYIMQYKSKKIDDYIREYVTLLNDVTKNTPGK